MLTDSDLKKIGNLIDEKLESKLEEKLETKLKPIKEDVESIRNDQKTLINFFDKEYLELRKRVEKIEKYLKLN